MKAPALFFVLLAAGLACRAPTGAALVAGPATATPSQTARASVTPSPIQPSATIQPEPSATSAPACVVTAWRLFVRRGPGKNTGALGVVESGDVLAILEPGAWLRVRTPAGVGYVSSAFCEVQP